MNCWSTGWRSAGLKSGSRQSQHTVAATFVRPSIRLAKSQSSRSARSSAGVSASAPTSMYPAAAGAR